MRNIKFRAWDYDTQRMIFESDIVFHDGTAYASKRDYKDCISIDMELMQYTGLKDKNGVEIYEGDIISVFDCNTEFIGSGEVIFKNYSYCVRWLESKDEYIMTFDECDFDCKTINVIGNIYENKELLDV